MKKKSTKTSKWPWYLLGSLLIIGLFCFFLYKSFLGRGLKINSLEKTYLYIPTHSTIKDLENQLIEKGFIEDSSNFEWAVKIFKFKDPIKPGKYEVMDGLSFKKLFRKIQLGQQSPVELVLHNLRLRTNLAGFVSRHLEADSISIMNLLKDQKLIDSLGFTQESFYALFIPNTYQIKWNTNAKQFILRMYAEYEKFWNPDRRAKAANHGLSPIQVLILASIVNQESNKPEDMTLIAGVYLNRLKKGMKLEADPTVVYANQDFTIRRVISKYLEKDSPYNTYKYVGLPPGPITMPSEQAIEAVLNSPPTDYLYFCAKDDFSGYHAFAVTEQEHRINARKFHEAMNARNIH